MLQSKGGCFDSQRGTEYAQIPSFNADSLELAGMNQLHVKKQQYNKVLTPVNKYYETVLRPF